MKRLTKYGLAVAAAVAVSFGIPSAAQADDTYYIGAYHSQDECHDEGERYEDWYGGFSWCEYDVWDGRQVWKLYLHA